MNEEKGKSRCSDGERILKCDYFIAGNSNPAFVPLAAQAHVNVSNWERFTIWPKLDTPETD